MLVAITFEKNLRFEKKIEDELEFEKIFIWWHTLVRKTQIFWEISDLRKSQRWWPRGLLLINLQETELVKKARLHFILHWMKWKLKNSAKKQCQDKYKQSMSKRQIKQQRSSPRSEEAERVSTYRTLAWFSSPAMLRVTRARWITIDSRQNRIECHYEDLFLYTHYVLKVLTWLFISYTQGVSVLLLKSA